MIQTLPSNQKKKHKNPTSSVPIADIPEVRTHENNEITTEIPAEIISEKCVKKRTKKTSKKAESILDQGIQAICLQTQFYEALSLVSCATPNKPTHPILANVLILADCKNQKVHLTVTDLALTIHTSFDAQVIEGGQITVPVEMLTNIVRQFPPGSITLNSRSPSCAITVSDVDSKYEIQGISAEEFPATSAIKAVPISIPLTLFKEGLKGVLYAISLDETKHILTGVNLQIGRENLKLIATDGHRLAVTELGYLELSQKQQLETNELFQFNVPGRVLKELIRKELWTCDWLNVFYDSQSNKVAFVSENITMSCQCLEGMYPDCEQLLAKFSFDYEVKLEKAPLMKALERLAVLTDKKEKGILLQFDGKSQQLRLSIERDFGRGSEVIAIQQPSDIFLAIQLNLKYLMETVKVIPSPILHIHLKQPDHPIILTLPNEGNHPESAREIRHLLMPLHQQ